MNTTPDSLSASWADYSARVQRSASAAKTYRYDNVYAKGYFLTNGRPGDFLPDNWTRVTLRNGYKLVISPERNYSLVEGQDCATLILGDAFYKESGSMETGRTAAILHSALQARPGFESFEDTVLACSGRFLAIAFKSAEVRVYTDPMASLSCFWAQKGFLRKSTFLSSHSALIALATEQPESTLKRWIMEHPEYTSPMGKTLPALIAPHDCSRELFGNCYLQIRGSTVSHTRYFPKHALEPMTVDEATDVFIDEMRFNTEAWLNVADQAYIALTAGRDSRAVLSASLDLFNARRDDVTMMTYHFFNRGTEGTSMDLLKANQMALDAGLRFKVVNIDGFDDSMRSLYMKTFSGWSRFPTLASALYNQLQADSSLFIGIGGGIGTTFFVKRDQTSITPELLARKYSNTPVSEDPELISKFQEYIEYTHFTDDRLHGYDLYDLFHWEHRLTKWAGASYAEYDLTATVALPFNSRRLILAMLALPYEQRLSKALYAEIGNRSGIV